MIYLLKYNSYNRYLALNPANDTSHYIGKNSEVDEKFLKLEDRGWYTKVNFKLTTFYRLRGDVFFTYGNVKVEFDKRTRFLLNRDSRYPFLNRILLFKGDKKVLDTRYWPKKNLLKSFDTTLGQEDYDLDLIALIYHISSHDDKMNRFEATGFY